MRTARVKYREGDVFLIPSSVSGSYVGQIVLDTEREIGAPFCFVYRRTVSAPIAESIDWLDASDVIAASLITPELIESGHWKIVARSGAPAHEAVTALQESMRNGFVGTTVFGSGLVAEYLDTYYGLIAETRWADVGLVYRFFVSPPMAGNREH